MYLVPSVGTEVHLRMLEERKAWKREGGFNRIDTAAEMDAKRFRTSLVSEPFYSKLFNLRWPHTPDEFTLEMRVDVERLRMEIIFSQPAPPPQCDPSPRRLPAVDTESEEPGTPRQSTAVGTRSDEPGVLRAETQSTEREEIVPLEVSVDEFLLFNCSSLEQEFILFQPDVGVDDNNEATTPTVKAGAHKEFAALPIGWQKRETASTEQSKQLDPGGRRRSFSLFVENKFHCSLLCPHCFVFFSRYIFLSCPKSKYKRRG